jgi:hypothetical protein
MASLLIFLACTPDASKTVSCEACGGDCSADVLPNRGQSHVTDTVDYEDHPPASGNHNACWASWGVHSDVVPPENWVHNLEHGAVVYLWNCPDGCDEDRSALETFAATLPPARIVVTEYDDMDWQFAAVSWQNRLLLNCLDLAEMSRFFDEHVGQAPENSMDPPGSGCM